MDLHRAANESGPEYSRTAAPLRVTDVDSVEWGQTTDILIVGLGGAGVCAALEAAENKSAHVMAVDLFSGGGATAISGGVYYGGATEHQKSAGYEDTPDEMFKYLKQETLGVISEETLQSFCRDSDENLRWLEHHGVEFSSALSPIKTSYPSDDYFLYYSGNELQPAYAQHAKSAPRGHRVKGRGLSGKNLFAPLLNAALKKGIEISPFSEVTRFVIGSNGDIAGVEIRSVPIQSRAARRLKKLENKYGGMITRLFAGRAKRLSLAAYRILDAEGELSYVKVNDRVILCAGGFVSNREMIQHHAPKFIGAMALGSIGCNGSGIVLGQSVGGQVDRLDHVSTWRQINPPAALAQGVIVNSDGCRIVSEDSYGAKIGQSIVDQDDDRAWVILDRKLRWQAVKQALPSRGTLFQLQGAPALMGLFFGTLKAKSLGQLETKCGMQTGQLKATVEHYNDVVENQSPTGFLKHHDFQRDISNPPFYAMDISISSKTFPCPTITLGGLVVNEKTGQVINSNGEGIPKLFAAGRNAVGVASQYYVSGLSIADCVFSGRRAARCIGNTA